MAHRQCNVDLGNTAKGVQEMEEAANQSGTADLWNQAAYRLADHGVELDRAESWSETAITIGSAQLRNLSLEHITPTQMRLAHRMASYWDTQGWVYFRRDQIDKARTYVETAWRLHPSSTMGNHLGQIYEKLNRRDNAVKTYAMAIAAADLPTKAGTQPEDLAEAMDRLAKLVGPDADIPDTIKHAKTDLEVQRWADVENSQKTTGDADFVMKVGAEGISGVRQVSGDASLAPFAEVLRKNPLSVQAPEGTNLELPHRGTLSCKAGDGQCRFKLLRSEEALDLAVKEASAENPKSSD